MTAFVRCSCGAEHSQLEWASLPFVGRSFPLGLAHRNCRCGSTLSVTLAEDAVAELEKLRARLIAELGLSVQDDEELTTVTVRLEAGIADLVKRLRMAEDELLSAPYYAGERDLRTGT